MSTPASTIYVCSGVRLNPSYEHTIYFSSATDQSSYFAGKVAKTFSAYTYLRKSWKVKVESTMSQARSWSYLYFANSDGKKWYYFITNIEYINDSTVELSLELDVMQTYMFDYTLLPSFVEREHSASDDIGEHILDEGLELGEFIVNNQLDLALGDYCLLILSSINLYTTTAGSKQVTLGSVYNGVYSGLSIYAVDLSNTDAQSYFNAKLGVLNEEGWMDAIVAMWMYPKSLVRLAGHQTWSGDPWCKTVSGVESYERTIPKNYDLHGYTPKNNKLKCYPFNFMYVSNNAGNACVYKYERFTSDDCNVKLSGAVSPEGGAVLYPLEYNGTDTNYEEGIMLSGFPSCAWNADVYKLWLAQNQNSQNLSIGMGALSIVGGVAGIVAGVGTGGMSAVAGVGAIIGGASQIASVMSARADQQVQPPQARGNYSVNVNVANSKQTFTVQSKSVDYTHARSIDNYFSMYGYKCHRVKTPNRYVRTNWTYTKTIGCHISGNLCTEDLQKIESIYNNGVTFWVNGDSIGNYALSNTTL